MSSERMNVFTPIQHNGTTFWLRLGSAYRNKDGSINVYLDGLPTNGKLQLRVPSERERQDAAGDDGKK